MNWNVRWIQKIQKITMQSRNISKKPVFRRENEVVFLDLYRNKLPKQTYDDEEITSIGQWLGKCTKNPQQ